MKTKTIIFLVGILFSNFFLCGKSLAQVLDKGFILVDPEYSHSFKFENGERYFPMGDTSYFLLGKDEAVIRNFIDSRASHKFNFLRIGAIGTGFWPFGGTPASPNYTQINETAMQKLDRVFDYAAGKGMNIELILWTYGVEGGEGLWGNETRENFWVDSVVNRYKNRKNLFMYTVANEFERYPNGAYSFSSSDVEWAKRIATRIRTMDTTHPIGAHPSHWISNIPPYSSFLSYNGISQHLPQVVWPLWENGNVNIFNVQNNQGVQIGRWSMNSSDCGGITSGCVVYETTSWQGLNYPATWTSTGWDMEGPGMEDSIAEDWSHGKPVINTEFGYQFETSATDQSRQMHQIATVRKKAWKIVTAGGFFSAGFANAAVGFSSDNTTNWHPEQLEYLYNFFVQKTEYWKMAPHLELVASQNSLLALPGTEYVAYFLRGGTSYINLQSGSYTAEWFNPETGTYYQINDITSSGGNYNFTPPNSTTSDWVLHLRKIIPTTQSPYPGPSSHNVPGIIEAENFDSGGEGLSYHDITSENQGGSYRVSEGVDIQTCSEGGYNIGWTSPGEWLEYSINVSQADNYDLIFRVAADPSAGGSVHAEIDGNNLTGNISINSTGGWQSWADITKNNIFLPQGEHILKIYFDSTLGTYLANFNKITLVQSGAPVSPMGLSVR